MDTVRIEQLLGNKKVIVGTKYNDLVLETLGKVYVKSGNNFKLLTDLIGTLNKSDPKNTIIVSSITEMENMKYPGDGYFVFSKSNNVLYLSYDNRYIKLIEADIGEDLGYVRKSGDTMSGLLEINTDVAPLIVASSELVQNFNAEFINGYKSDDLAKKRVDELIYGSWTFKNSGISEEFWTFNKNVEIKLDIILHLSIGSPYFASGFGGYGWRFDADTNTLTVDYLVVRKAMNVYELVVNLINATNGSLWVSNATTIKEVELPLIVTVNQLNYFELDESNSLVGWQRTDAQKERFKALFFENKYYLITDDTIGDTLSTNGDTKGREDLSPLNIGIVKETTGLSTSSTINTIEKSFVNYKYIIKITDIDGLLSSAAFLGKSTLLDENQLKNLSMYIKFTYISKKAYNNTYIETFDKDCGFYALVLDTKIKIKSYYKYYGLKKETMQSAITSCINYFNSTHNKSLNFTVPSLFIITSEKYTYFKPGDVIRCQKFLDNNIKYYDAVVLSLVGDKSVIILKADSVFDQYTEVKYVNGEKVQYTTTYSDKAYTDGEKGYDETTDSDIYLEGYETEEERLSSRLSDPSVEDDVVLMGNIYDPTRQNAIYITSSDDLSPFMDVIGDVNRPDYSVLYKVPVFLRYSYINTTVDNGYRGVRYNYYLLSPTTENSKIQNVVPIYIDNTLTYYGTTTPMDNSLITLVNGLNQYEYTSSTKVRVGKLDGITNYMFGNNLPYGYGLYGENVFLTGEFYLNNGKSVVDFTKEYVDITVEGANLNINDLIQDVGNINLDISLLKSQLTITSESITAVSTRVSAIETASAGWVTTALGNTLWATKAENLEAANNAKLALQDAATAIGNAAAANTLASTANNAANNAQNTANNALNAASNAQSTANSALSTATANATWINNNKDRITLISGQFDASGNLTNTSGLVTLSNFSTLFANAVDADGNIVKLADISVFVTEDEMNTAISNIKLTADKITLEGYTTINGGFRIDTLGSMYAISGLIGGFTITSSNLYAGSTTLGNYVSLSPDRIYFNYTDNSRRSMASFGSNGSGVIPGVSGISMPIGIYRNITNLNNISDENVGLYIYCNGGHKYDNVPYSGNIAIDIASGFIRGLRLNVKLVTNSTSSGNIYQLTDADNYIIVYNGYDGVRLPSNPQEGLIYIIRKANQNGVIYVNSNYQNIIQGENPSVSVVSLCGIDGWKAIVAVYTTMLQDSNGRGYWWINTLWQF